MRIVITSGPSYEPLDKVRRLTNSSTGELGTLMAEGFAEAGHSVTCFRGVASTFAEPLWPVNVIPFTTNDDLATGLRNLPDREETTLVLHAAALCDFRVASVLDADGKPIHADKIASRAGSLSLTLEPTPKLISSLRRMFPSSIIVGWKFELDGSAEDVRAKGRKQMDDCLTDACVLNGKAFGPGFGHITRTGEETRLPDKAALCRYLIDWAERIPMAMATPGQES